MEKEVRGGLKGEEEEGEEEGGAAAKRSGGIHTRQSQS